MKRRLKDLMKKKMEEDQNHHELRQESQTGDRPVLKKFYGLPPQSIMDSFMPKSIVDTLTEKNKKKKKKPKDDGVSQSAEDENENPVVSPKEEDEKSSSPLLKSSLAADWGEFGRKIQSDFEEINRKYMMDQSDDSANVSTTTTTDHPWLQNQMMNCRTLGLETRSPETNQVCNQVASMSQY